MFFISKTVADGIKSLGRQDEVQRQIETIRAVPGFEIYANAVAEGIGGRKAKRAAAAPDVARDAS